MIPKQLYEELEELIENATGNMIFQTPEGENVKLHIYHQDTPKKQSDEEAEEYPYCVIRIANGSTNATDAEKNYIRVILLFGIYDSSPKNSGHVTILSIMNKLLAALSKNNLLAHFVQKGDIAWVLDDEDAFPYFFGGMDMTFVPTMVTRREIDDLL